MNGLYVLEAISAVDNTNKISSQTFTNTLPNLFFTSKRFLNNGTEHNIAAINIIISKVSI